MTGTNKQTAEIGLPGVGDAAAAAATGERGPGRPKGSMNRRSRDWQKWWDASGKRHPLMFLADVISATPAELRERYGAATVLDDKGEEAQVAGLGAKDVLALQIRAAEAALPYLEQKLPMAVEDVSEGKRMVVVVGGMSQAQQGALQARFGLKLRGEQNQGVIEAEPVKSDDSQSDEQANLLDYIEKAGE
jgi:hypothetical protein